MCAAYQAYAEKMQLLNSLTHQLVRIFFKLYENGFRFISELLFQYSKNEAFMTLLNSCWFVANHIIISTGY